MGNIMGIYLLLSPAIRACRTGWATGLEAAGLCCLLGPLRPQPPCRSRNKKEEKGTA